MSGWIHRWLLWRRRAEQQAAKEEVLAQVREHPVGAYGLYHVLDDAGLLTEESKDELAPLMASIARRLDLGDEALEVSLPLAFEPLTDVEQDTLTALLGDALRAFARALPGLDEPLRLAELLGVVDLLARHVHETASLAYEVGLEEVLHPLLTHGGQRLPFYRDDGVCNARPGDYFRVTRVKRSKRTFPDEFVHERHLREGEVVQVERVGKGGYMTARRLTPASPYSRVWSFKRLGRSLPRDGHLTAVHQDEGELYRLAGRYEGAAARLIELYRLHLPDHSVDPAIYQPRRPGAAGEG